MANATSSANPPPVTPGAGSAPSIVSVSSVSKSFGETRALREVSFEARAGEIHAIVGENGSGKSTLAKVLSGIVLPDAGEVLIDGAAVRDPRGAMRAGIATVFQEVLIAEGATITENIFMGLQGPWRRSISRNEQRRTAGDLLSRLTGSDIDPDALVDDLPLATRQWVTIARSLVRAPKVIVFDESTAALDLDSATRLHREMQGLRSAGCCVLVVTHRISELTSFADRATVLRDGKDVGVLEGAEITLDKLLSLMSGVEEGEDTAGSRDAIAAKRRGAVDETRRVLVASSLRVAHHDDPSDFEVSPGEIVGFAGLDGQGQAEFIQALSGIRPFASGAIEVKTAGGDVHITSLRSAELARISYIPGDRRKEGIFSNLSIFENFGMPLYRAFRRIGVIDRRALDAAYSTYAQRLKLRAGSKDNLITSLSGGNQQKVIIGRVLAQKPRVVTLNDPARGVDIRTKRELYQQLEELALDGAAIVYLSTEIDELVGFCDRVAVFRDGAIFGWLRGSQINSDRILAAMFGHLEADFDIEDALAGQS